jgi:ABC-type Fe3+-hydroxamate transport system substrate-binding protein
MRIKNLLKYKKTSGIVAAVCLVLAIGSVWILSSNASNDKVKTAVAETTGETAKAKTAKKKSASKKKPAVKTGTCVKASEITNTVSDDNNILIYNSIPEKAEKIVSLDSDTTRNLVDMYATDKLVGVDTESAYRWEQLDKSIDVLRSADDIIAASPDIVFSGRSNYPSDYNDNVEQELIDAGICIVKIPPCISLEYTKEDMRFIGELIDDTGRAEDLISSFEEQISTVSSYCADIKESEKRSVVFIRYISTLLNESHYRNFKEISDLIGAKDLPVYEFEYDNSDEFRKMIQDIDPDVIIFEDMGMYTYNDFKSDKRFKDMKAVKNNAFGCIEFDKFRSTNAFDLSESIYRTWSAVYPESYDEMESNQPNS